MKRIMLTALALTMMVAPMAGCSGGDDNSCSDACNKLKSCGFISGSDVDACTASCKSADASQDDIDCIVDKSCGDILDRC